MGKYSQIVILLLAAFAKVALISIYMKGGLSNSGFVLLANPLSAFGLALLWQKVQRNFLRSLGLFVVDALIPIFGFLCVSLFILFQPLFKRMLSGNEATGFTLPMGEEGYKKYFEDKRIIIEGDKEKKEQQRLHDSYNIEPYVDILDGGNLDLKINAIEKLSRNYTSESVSILKQALEGREYEVRYFANNALEKIEKHYLEKIEVISEEINRQPDDSDLYNQRAGFYLDSYLIGILDEYMGRFFLERCLYDFIFSMQLKPGQSYLFVKMVQIHLLLKDYGSVISISDKALKESITEEDRAKILFFRAEANFFLRNFKKVKEDCEKVVAVGIEYKKVKDSSEWWKNLE